MLVASDLTGGGMVSLRLDFGDVSSPDVVDPRQPVAPSVAPQTKISGGGGNSDLLYVDPLLALSPVSSPSSSPAVSAGKRLRTRFASAISSLNMGYFTTTSASSAAVNSNNKHNNNGAVSHLNINDFDTSSLSSQFPHPTNSAPPVMGKSMNSSNALTAARPPTTLPTSMYCAEVSPMLALPQMMSPETPRASINTKKTTTTTTTTTTTSATTTPTQVSKLSILVPPRIETHPLPLTPPTPAPARALAKRDSKPSLPFQVSSSTVRLYRQQQQQQQPSPGFQQPAPLKHVSTATPISPPTPPATLTMTTSSVAEAAANTAAPMKTATVKTSQILSSVATAYAYEAVTIQLVSYRKLFARDRCGGRRRSGGGCRDESLRETALINSLIIRVGALHNRHCDETKLRRIGFCETSAEDEL